jgi:diaminohydroxyphosphoribosylaminopyrimidine deaminase/5-amino-6-(5-phosphoribosylamino)uracil reductase
MCPEEPFGVFVMAKHTKHERYMQRALELAGFARGRTSPNPLVGAVIVRGGEVVGEGYHRKAGTPHAEVHALHDAGERARGATLYVTLEPCSHYGRTPPCTEALIAAGIAEVYMAMLDPNPLVNGQGRERLEQAGIRTFVGLCEEEAAALNRPFVTYITQGRPLVIAKVACSLDGKIATRTGESRWISGKASRQRAHELRDEIDAIMVGANTVIVDDPRLTTRLPGREEVHHPLRIVVDSRGRVPLAVRLFDPELPGRTVLATTAACPLEHREALQQRGVEVLLLPAGPHGRVDLPALLRELGRLQVTSLLVEGGGTLLDAFFRARLVDQVLAFVAPLIIGGREAPPAVGGEGVSLLREAPRLVNPSVERVGEDFLISGVPRWMD